MPSRRQRDRARQARHLLLSAERRVDDAVLAAMAEWLQTLRFLILRDLGDPAVTAAGYPHAPHVVDGAAQQSWGTWRRQLDRQVIPTVSVVFGEAFQQARRRDPSNSYQYQQQYMADVFDRLKIWPEGAFEDIRPELMEALAEAESIDDIRDRVGRVLNIDARTRAVRATIHEVEQRLEDPDLDPNARRVLTARRRELWAEHDESLGEWQWKARRIARTEAHGAVEAGQYASAQERATADGIAMYARWLATDDTRTRTSHRVADGQVVPLGGKFRVGGWLLSRPGDPTAPPSLTINCRCAALYYDSDELQDELQGPDGSIGEIRPGGVRLGPDDPDDAEQAAVKIAAEEGRALPATHGQRGEDHGQAGPGEPEQVELTPDREQLPPLDRTAIGAPDTDLTKLSDDQLLDEMQRANDTDNDNLWHAAEAEWDRRRHTADPHLDQAEDEPASLPTTGPPPAEPPPPSPLPTTGGNDDEPDWDARQAALGIDTHGEKLEQSEIEFVEQFHGVLNQQIEWIPRDRTTFRPTNDFVWVNNGNRAYELKTPKKAKYASAADLIRQAVSKARAQNVVKDRFVINLGHRELRPTLAAQLSSYNQRNPENQIRELWVMAAGVIHRLRLL